MWFKFMQIIRSKLCRESNPGVFILTCLAWIGLGLMLGLVIVSICWWLLRNLWFKELFIPDAVQLTFTICVSILCWASFLYVGLSAYTKYKKRQKEPNIQECPPESSSVSYALQPKFDFLSKTGIPYEYITAYEVPRLTVQEYTDITSLPPDKILSKAVILSRNGKNNEAIGLLRIILDHPNAAYAVKKIARYRLMRLLENTELYKSTLSK